MDKFKTVTLPWLARTLQSVRKRLEAPLNKLENATVSLEKDVQEKFSKLFGGSVSEAGKGDGEGASGGSWTT